MKYLKYILPLLFAAPLVASAAISVPWQAPSPTSGPITPALVNGANKSIVATSTSVIYVNGNRTDPYTADGTYFYPYKTLTAAAASITAAGLTSVAVHVAPGTYAEPSLIWPNVPTVMYGNGASIVMMNGSFALGAGTFTVPGDFSFYDFNVFGGFSATNPSTSNPHFLTNCLIVGTSTFAGNATLNNCATLDQNTAVFPFLSQNASSTMTFQPGSLGNIVGSNIQSNIVNKGVLNLNDVQVIGATSSAYLIDSSTAGSELLVNGATFINRGTGGGINCSNTATAAAPNAMTNFTVTVGVGTPTNNALNCGNAFSYVNIYSASDFAGNQYIASGPGLRAQIQTGLTVEGTSTLNAIPGTLTGLSSTTPFADLSIHANNGELTKYLFAIGSSTQTATTTLFSVSNTGAASTTQLFGAGLASCSGSSALTWSSGLFGCTNVGAAAFPFTPTAYGVSTSTVVGFTNGLLSMGSTTINGNATTTGSAYIAGSLGIGTTSMAGKLNVEGSNAVVIARPNSNTGYSEIVAGGYTYASAFDSVFIKKYSNGATGNLIGNIPNGNLGALAFQNTTNALIYTNNQTPLILATFGTEALRIGGTGATNHAFVGLSTTSPFAKLSIQANTTDKTIARTLFAIGSSTQTATSSLFLVDNVGHTYKGGTTPTLSAGSFFGIANDNVGTVLTDTTAATIFTLTFANPWYTAPACELRNDHFRNSS